MAGTSVMAVLDDMSQLRDNAHAFNVGDENVEARIMADCVHNYFRYLLKRCLVVLPARMMGSRARFYSPL